jgi:hypothetical protein
VLHLRRYQHRSCQTDLQDAQPESYSKKATRKFRARECKDLLLAVLLQEKNRLTCDFGLFTPLYDLHMQSTAAHTHTHTHTHTYTHARAHAKSADSNKILWLLP